MQRKRTIKCPVGSKRFTAVSVNDEDVAATRTFERAMEFLVPSHGDLVKVYAICARDAEAARHAVIRGEGELIRTFRSKGWQYPKRATRGKR